VAYFFPDPKEWNVTIHASTNTITKKDVLKKRAVMGNMLVRRSTSGFFGFQPKIQWEKTDLVCLYDFKLFPHVFVLLKTFFLKISGNKKYAMMFIPSGGFNPYWKKYGRFRRWGKQLYHRFIGRFLINLTADGILASSLWEKRSMIKQGIRRELIVVIPNGVEMEAFEDYEKKASEQIKKSVKDYGTYILQIGRIHPVKNYETAIRALTYLPNSVNLVIAGPVGDADYFESLKILTAKYDVTNQVFFHDTVRSFDKYYLIKHAQMMLHTAIWDAFGTVIFEGMSQGLVCLAPENSAMTDIIKDEVNGFLIPAKDDLIIGKKINYILKHKKSSQIQHMIKQSMRIGQKYKEDTLQRKLEILYSSVLIKHKYPYRMNMNKTPSRVI